MSWPTAKRWADRYAQQGQAGKTDRSSRPHSRPDRTPQPTVRKIVHLRWKQRLGPVAIADQVGPAASTAHAVLVRSRINRLSHVDRPTGEPVRRYEHPHPGSLLHVDVNNARQRPRRRRLALRRPPTGREAPVGDHHPHRGAAQAPWRGAEPHRLRAHRHRRPQPRRLRRGPRRRDRPQRHRRAAPSGRLVRRPRRDHRAGAVGQRQRLQELRLARRVRRAGHRAQADPALPPADQRQDRTLPPHPRRRLGLPAAASRRVSPPQGPAGLAPRVQPSPTGSGGSLGSEGKAGARAAASRSSCGGILA